MKSVDSLKEDFYSYIFNLLQAEKKEILGITAVLRTSYLLTEIKVGLFFEEQHMNSSLPRRIYFWIIKVLKNEYILNWIELNTKIHVKIFPYFIMVNVPIK